MCSILFFYNLYLLYFGIEQPHVQIGLIIEVYKSSLFFSGV